MKPSQFSFEFDDRIPAEKGSGEMMKLPEENKPKRGRKKLSDTSVAIIATTVPDDEDLFQKQYYPIGDVARMFNENTSLIRYWANEFSVLKPKKNKKGDRLFRPEDVKNLKMIHHLLRERKYTLEGAKDYLKNNKAAGEKHEIIESLEKIKLFLLELKNNL